MSSEDDLNTSAIAVAGLVAAIVVFAVIVLLMVIFYQVEARQEQAKDVDQPYAEVDTLVADQQGRLASYGWVDPKRQVAHIPVKRAMDLVTAELSRDPEARVTGLPPEQTRSGGPGPPQAKKSREDKERPKAQDSTEEATPPHPREAAGSDAAPDAAKEDQDAK